MAAWAIGPPVGWRSITPAGIKAIAERSLKTTKRVATERTVPEWRAALEWRAAPLLFVFASVAAGFVFLYLVGLWVDHY